MNKDKIKEWNERFFITNKINYKFNKIIFTCWFALVLILMGFVMISYDDYKEVEITCNEISCKYNNTIIENLTLIEYNLRDDVPTRLNFSFEKIIYVGEHLVYATYERPFIIEYFIDILIITLFITFLINHIWYKSRGKNDTNN